MAEHDVVRAGAELVDPLQDQWLTPKAISGPLVIFIHGFTSHGRYLKVLARFIGGFTYAGKNCVPAIYNFDSYLGIDFAARDLDSLLQPYAEVLSEHGFALVAHSMGGLVARNFLQIASADVSRCCKALVLLGTPNQATVKDSRIVDYMLDWSEAVSGISPFSRSPVCRSAQQLTGSDDDRLVVEINRLDVLNPPSVPTLSVSGGLGWLQVGEKSKYFRDRIANRQLQKIIGEVPNDGLVGETSANLAFFLQGRHPDIHHENGYGAFKTTNHTNLTQNQQVASQVVKFLQAKL